MSTFQFLILRLRAEPDQIILERGFVLVVAKGQQGRVPAASNRRLTLLPTRIRKTGSLAFPALQQFRTSGESHSHEIDDVHGQAPWPEIPLRVYSRIMEVKWSVESGHIGSYGGHILTHGKG